MKSNKVKISQSEWEIMEILWHQSPLSASEVFNVLGPDTHWNVKTVRSFLDRLEQKQAVLKEKVHGINVYKPIPRRHNCLRQESRTFLDRFFQGNPVSMISHFIKQEKLSEADIDRIQKLLESRNTSDKK